MVQIKCRSSLLVQDDQRQAVSRSEGAVMRPGIDRSVIAGIILLAVMMVGIAATSYLNTRKLREDATRAAHSREVLDAIASIRADTRKLQAGHRAFVISGIESWLQPYDEAAAALRAEIEVLKTLIAIDPDQFSKAEAAGREIESGIAGFDEMNVLRRKKGYEAILAISHVRGMQSFVDPLLATLAEMDQAERERLTVHDRETDEAYSRAIFYAAIGAVLGLLALGMFVRLLERSILARAQDAARLAEQRELLNATLTSIGDGVIATDAAGSITFLNAVAERLTGSSQADARNLPLETVFRILHETTRQPVENPAKRTLEQGVIVGRTNHTLLIARDGSERPIDLSAAPIKTLAGAIYGAVLVFRDITDRTLAEEAVERKQVLLRTFIDALPDVAFIKDTAGRITLCNRAHMVRSGAVEEAEIVGKTVFELYPSHLATGYHEDDLRVFEHGETVFNREELSTNAIGQEEWYLTTKVPLRDRYGAITGLVGISHYIQDRKEAESAMRVSEEMFRGAFDHTAVAMVLTSIDNVLTRVNTAFAELFGYSPQEMLGMGIADVTHPDDRARIYAHREALLAGEGNFFQVEKRYLHRDGHIFWGLTNVSLVRDPTGRPLMYVGQVQDVTERKRAYEALELRDRAMQAVSQGIVITDPTLPDNPIVYASPGFERMTGYAATDVLGQNCRLLQGKDTDRTIVSAIRDAIREARACAVELVNYRKDGTPFWNALDIAPIRDRGRVTHFVGVLMDVTDRRRLVSQLTQSQKMEAVGQLAGGVAHDFNNLLTVINGYSQILLDTLPDSDPSRTAVTAVLDAGERAVGLTTQLLAFSRHSVLRTMVLDPNVVVAETGKLLRRLIGEDITLTATLSPEIGRVKADPGQLGQVLMNLAVNARDAMPQGGRITIETRTVDLDEGYARVHPDVQAGKHVLIAVTDTGTGMPPEVLVRLFEPFFTTKEPGKGTGLGLATVYGIVKQSGGHVEAYSEVGVGSTFKVYLPMVEEQVKPNSGSNRAQALGGTESVLLVEDQVDVRRLAQRTLRAHGYSVLEAADGQEALGLVEWDRPRVDILVTDVVMPGMSGPRLAEALRHHYPGLKVLYVSGYTDDAVVRHGLLAQEVAFLQKPYTLLALAHQVRAVLDTPEAVTREV